MPDTTQVVSSPATAIATVPQSQITEVEAGSIARSDFAGDELEVLAETNATAAAARARAEIEAAFIVAMKRPRDIVQVHARVIKECRRTGFAEVARYSRPVGGGEKAEGPSIRFAEAAARAMGNIRTGSYLIYENDSKRTFKVVALDLETNTSYEADAVVTKTVERRFPEKGRKVYGSRKNSKGQDVYIVEAYEGDLRTKENAEISKTLRTLLLRLIPGDIVDDAMNQVKTTLQDRAAKDPDGERKAITNGFMELGVEPKDLAEYLGHTLDKTVPVELVELRGLYRSIRDGQITWNDALASKAAQLAEAAAEKDKAANGGEKKGAAAAAEKLAGKKVEKPAGGELELK